MFVFVLTVGGEHATSRAVVWPSDNFPNKARVPGSYHVSDTWNISKHLTHFLFLDVLFVNFRDGDAKDLPHTIMEEYK